MKKLILVLLILLSVQFLFADGSIILTVKTYASWDLNSQVLFLSGFMNGLYAMADVAGYTHKINLFTLLPVDTQLFYLTAAVNQRISDHPEWLNVPIYAIVMSTWIRIAEKNNPTDLQFSRRIK